jgi:hypothetical protein
MHTLKLIWLTFIQLLKQIGSIPEAIKRAAKQRQQQTVLKELEVERLDRIRNPLKYRGK